MEAMPKLQMLLTKLQPMERGGTACSSRQLCNRILPVAARSLGKGLTRCHLRRYCAEAEAWTMWLNAPEPQQ